MKARIEHRWPYNTVAVWLYRPPGVTGYVEVLELGPPGADEAGSVAPSWRRLDHADPPGPPTLELPVEALEALVAEASNLRPPNTEQAAALTDARNVRDRLLSLVEGLVTPAGAVSSLRTVNDQ